MIKKSAPIGVFDSGVGGLSVLAELVKQMPYENYIYLGDRKNAPYGSRTAADVLRLSEENAKRLIDLGAKCLVIACNTATAAAADRLRHTYASIPIVGIEPAVKPASRSACRRVAVLATPRTVESARFAELLRANSTECELVPVPCPRLAGMIERGEDVRDYLSELLSGVGDFDGIVLGCTHYPFVKNEILAAVGREVEIFDGAVGTAAQAKRRLEALGLLSDSGEGKISFISTDGDDAYIEKFFKEVTKCLFPKM
jgi:glutamate racemase